jgi:8-oxo-dGTP pyrophosphatase MutT (NUDIX family)
MNYDEPEFIDDGDEDLRPLKTPPQLSLTKNTHVGRKHRYTKRYYYRDRKPFINCSNCEGNGHLFKDCKKPIQSFGILAWTLKPNTLKETSLQSPLQSTTLSVCLIQRRHTISFEAFVRGKYDVDELQMHSERMTISEKKAILETDWDTLYDGVMNTKHALTNNTAELKQKQNVFTLRERDRAKLLYNSVDLKKLFGSDQSGVVNPTWEFPKGRKFSKETEEACALREFQEETGIPIKDVTIVSDPVTKQPIWFEEVFCGINKRMYHNRYMLAFVNPESSGPFVDPNNASQLSEVQDARFFTYQDAMSIIHPFHPEKRMCLHQSYETMKQIFKS